MVAENSVGIWVETWADRRSIQVEYTFETNSTNDLAKTFSYANRDLVVFVAETQKHGRGRGDNSWENAHPGTALLSSWSFGLTQSLQPIAAPLIGLAVFRALKQTFGTDGLSLKAPNDLYVGEKKVGGLLVEVLSQGSDHRAIIGFGLNVLDAPKLAVASALAGQTRVTIDKTSFHHFLDNLHSEWKGALTDATRPQLSNSARAELLEALNRHPHLK